MRLLNTVTHLSLLALLAFLGIASGLCIAPVFAAPGQTYGYEVVQKIAHPRENFVQGLQIVGDTLYLGTGQYGESRLLEYDFPAMTLRREVALPDALFGEGVTRLGERLYQLTWRAGVMRIYSADTLTLERTHRIGTQGWGITHNDSELIYSDGSDRLYVLDPETLLLKRTLNVRLSGRPLPRLNELEWIEGEIWANVWQANQLVRIDPESGDVVGIVDLRGLLDPRDRRPDTDVLNGIAWDAEQRALWVTGKRWPWLYQIRLIAQPGARP
jgi:glutamine cyclotransferase